MAVLVFSDSIPISRKVAFTEFESHRGGLGGCYCAWSSLPMALAVRGAPAFVVDYTFYYFILITF